jgi:Tfp pilus assembly protein PilO
MNGGLSEVLLFLGIFLILFPVLILGYIARMSGKLDKLEEAVEGLSAMLRFFPYQAPPGEVKKK